MRSGLVDRHIAFLEALRGAGLPVSLAEDLDAIAALQTLDWTERHTIRDGYAATLVKRQSQRPTFEALFDIYFPRMVGDGAQAAAEDEAPDESGVRDNAAALQDFRAELLEALGSDDPQALARLAPEMVARFGAMPGRGPGLSSWSAYTALQRVSPSELVDQIVQGLLAEGRSEEEAQRVAGRITSARKADLEEMRREIYPLARRLATRLTKEHHAKRRGPLDFRRTVRASMSTGGVPMATHHRPKRPHRTELVVLCDVSGSVANFAQFTLLLVFALRDQFQKVRAFTFIDHVHEVTHHFRPGADVVDVMSDLAASTAHAALWGRTNYGRAFTKFAEEYGDALGPKSSLLVLGDARSNYSDLAEGTLKELAGAARHCWWLNPEHRRHWGTGDSAAPTYGEIVPMVECRNLTQLGDFVHDLAG
jgi:uncharacterized protein